MSKKTVFVGMSGGVDSSVSAALLKEQDYNVVGVHMRCYNVDGCAEQDAEDARRAAETLDIPFYTFDLEQEYKEKVVEYMINGYKKGITPNPDVMCNKEIKFGLFFEKAMKLGADYVATGHYVKKIGNSLFEGADENKDQSYFLWAVPKEAIKKSLFPVGAIKKDQVRNKAKKYNLHNANKKDSQGICFLGAVKIPEFLSNYIPNKKGDIVDQNGKKIGTHKGAYYYTIGQRHGLGVGGFKTPHYVASKDIKKNTITLAPEGSDLLTKNQVEITNLNLFVKSLPKSCYARVRYRGKKLPVTLEKTKKGNYLVTFKTPEKYIATGQSVVFYKKDLVKKGMKMLGGGEIVKSEL